MAKKKSKGVNKSQAVRDYLAEHPNATASIIRPALAERGIDVSVTLISQIKQRMKKSGKTGPGKSPTKKKAVKKKSPTKMTQTKAAATTSRAGKSLTAEDLVEAKKLADELGGIDQARKALKYLEELG